MRLTVIFRDDGPMVFCNDSPSYRSTQIELTPEQEKALTLKYVGIDRGNVVHESISKCFLEGDSTLEEPPKHYLE